MNTAQIREVADGVPDVCIYELLYNEDIEVIEDQRLLKRNVTQPSLPLMDLLEFSSNQIYGGISPVLAMARIRTLQASLR